MILIMNLTLCEDSCIVPAAVGFENRGTDETAKGKNAMKFFKNPDMMSIAVSGIVSTGVIIWSLVTHFRVPVDARFLPAPGMWYTAAMPVLFALLSLAIGVVLLSWSASRVFQNESMGVGDMVTAIVQAFVVFAIIILMFFGVIKYGPSFLMGIVAFALSSGAELLATLIVWSIANRRTFGVGSAPVAAH